MLNLDGHLYQKFVVLIIYLTFVISHSSTATEFLPSRSERDTYDEREKLASTYKIVSKTQCLLEMHSSDGSVYAKRVPNLDNTNEGSFLFLPVAVNLFFIQHKESHRFLCGRNHQLYGLTDANERECLFETKRSDVDFGFWDSYRLFYENSTRGYLSVSYRCHARLRKKYFNDRYLNFLAFIRINTDVTSQRIGYSPDLIRHDQQRPRIFY